MQKGRHEKPKKTHRERAAVSAARQPRRLVAVGLVGGAPARLGARLALAHARAALGGAAGGAAAARHRARARRARAPGRRQHAGGERVAVLAVGRARLERRERRQVHELRPGAAGGTAAAARRGAAVRARAGLGAARRAVGAALLLPRLRVRRAARRRARRGRRAPRRRRARARRRRRRDRGDGRGGARRGRLGDAQPLDLGEVRRPEALHVGRRRLGAEVGRGARAEEQQRGAVVRARALVLGVEAADVALLAGVADAHAPGALALVPREACAFYVCACFGGLGVGMEGVGWRGWRRGVEDLFACVHESKDSVASKLWKGRTSRHVTENGEGLKEPAK